MFVIILLFGLTSFLSCGSSNPILSGIDVGKITMQDKNPTVNGQTEFPFMAHLTIIEIETKNCKLDVYRCGGVIISENAILTAGHCLADPLSNPRVHVKTGFVHSELERHSAQVRWMKNFVLHDGFLNECISLEDLTVFCLSDIAIVFLRKPFVFGSMVQRAILSESDIVPANKEGWILGWGDTITGKASEMLQKARMRVVDRLSCQKLTKKTVVNDDVFCLLSDTRESTNCRGDSGGPFIIDEKVYGIISFGYYTIRNGRRQSDPNKPSFVTNVGDYYEWIIDELNKENGMIQEKENSNFGSLLDAGPSTSTRCRKRPSSSDDLIGGVREKNMKEYEYNS